MIHIYDVLYIHMYDPAYNADVIVVIIDSIEMLNKI